MSTFCPGPKVGRERAKEWGEEEKEEEEYKETNKTKIVSLFTSTALHA